MSLRAASLTPERGGSRPRTVSFGMRQSNPYSKQRKWSQLPSPWWWEVLPQSHKERWR